VNFNNLPIEYILVGMLIIILYLLYYVYSKDAYYNKNIHSVANVVEDLNRELFYMKKKLSETENSMKDNLPRMSDEEIYQEIERSVYDMVHPLSLGFKQMQENINAIDEQIDSRISILESGVKQMSVPNSVNGNDNDKIISLFKQGISLDTISKELHISKPEVEFILKLNRMK